MQKFTMVAVILSLVGGAASAGNLSTFTGPDETVQAPATAPAGTRSVNWVLPLLAVGALAVAVSQGSGDDGDDGPPSKF